jgi:hypothetical protein
MNLFDYAKEICTINADTDHGWCNSTTALSFKKKTEKKS